MGAVLVCTLSETQEHEVLLGIVMPRQSWPNHHMTQRFHYLADADQMLPERRLRRPRPIHHPASKAAALPLETAPHTSVAICALVKLENPADVLEWLDYHRCVQNLHPRYPMLPARR